MDTTRHLIMSPTAARQVSQQVDRFLDYAKPGKIIRMKPGAKPIKFGPERNYQLNMAGKFVRVTGVKRSERQVAIYRDKAREQPLCTLRPGTVPGEIQITYGSAALTDRIVVEPKRPKRSHLLTADI